MKFEAPTTAPAHRALLDAVAMASLDRDALRRLLWLINAHPTLVAHALVFENILTHLESARCSHEELNWAGKWKDDIAKWSEICRWITENTKSLSVIVGLEDFDRQPKTASDNPHMHRGVTRHGVVAALWSRHESVAAYPPPSDGSRPAADRYFELQTHLFLSYVDSRDKWSSLEYYENYREPPESPIAPALTAGIGLAIREFSLRSYSPLLLQFPSNQSTAKFQQALSATSFSFDDLPEESREGACRYLEAIQRYFRRFGRVMLGLRPPQGRRKGGGGGGGHTLHPGFVHFQLAKGVYIGKRRPPPADPDLPYMASQPVYIDLDREFDDDPSRLESSGLSPSETLEATFRLYTPDELGGKLATARYQRLAIEMQGQFLPFSYTSLTGEEIRCLSRVIGRSIDEYLYSTPSNIQLARRDAIAALMTKVMLYFGQSQNAAREMQFAWRTRSEENSEGLPAVQKITLLLYAPTIEDWTNTHVVGFCMPAIMPNYKSAPDENLDEINRAPAESFLLPDIFGVGNQLLDFLQREARPNTSVFGIEPKQSRQAITQIATKCGDERITPDKITRVLHSILMKQTNDQSLAWMVTADRDSADEPRLHYTRHALCVLQRAYGRAARHLARDAGIHPARWEPPAQAKTEEATSVGARFVVRLDDLRGLISGLNSQLREPRRTPFTKTGILRYHDAYLLYTWLFQSLQTTMRAVTRPNVLYDSWKGASENANPLQSSLSDKDGRYSEKARLVNVGENLATQFKHYRLHIDFLIARLGLSLSKSSVDDADLPLLVISDKNQLQPLKPTWIEDQLKARFAPVPANFHRAFLRTELLERGCAAEAIDAFLGHANAGESPFGRYSTFDYGLHTPLIEKALQDIHDELELVPIASRLVPYPTRMAHA